MATKTTAKPKPRTRRRKPTWKHLMEDLIGKEATRKLLKNGRCTLRIEYQTPTRKTRKTRAFTLHLRGALVSEHDGCGHCIHPKYLGRITSHTTLGLEDLYLSILYPKVALLLTDMRKFLRTAG